MKKLSLFSVLSFLLISVLFAQSNPAPSIQGELKKWHTIRFLFDGPKCSETDFKPNPFLDFRLEVTFTNGNKKYKVPGFFAADGESSETSASSGNKWQVNFVPDEAGVWKYLVSFRGGKDISISNRTDQGTGMPPNGASGSFTVTATDKNAPGFLSKGRLEYVGERYLKFSETGQYFLRTDQTVRRIFWLSMISTKPTVTTHRQMHGLEKPKRMKAVTSTNRM